MSGEFETINELNLKVDFLLDVINLLEVNGLLPPKLIERSRNRVTINSLRNVIKEVPRNVEAQEQLNICLEKEMKYQKYFSKFSNKKILKRLMEKIG